jgi:hypothetical protein
MRSSVGLFFVFIATAFFLLYCNRLLSKVNWFLWFFWCHSQFHLRRDLLILESGSLAVLADVNFAFIPFIRRQKERRRFAFFDPGFSLLGLVVTAVCSFEPGFSRRYDSTPF